MSDLIEAMAKALCKADGFDPDAPLAKIQGGLEENWQLYTDNATAALAALEPKP